MDKKYLDEIKQAIDEKRITIGAKRTLKYLKSKKIKLVVISKNCPQNIKDDLEHYKKMFGIDVQVFDGGSKDMGIFCGKPYLISVLGIE